MIDAGAQAIPVGLGSGSGVLRLQCTVRVVPDGKGPASAALEQVRCAIRAEPSGFLCLVDGEEPVDFQVAVDEKGGLEILDAGGASVPNVPRGGPGQVAETVQRLVHLTRYRNIQQLENADQDSSLAGKLELIPLGTQRDFIKGDQPNPQPVVGSPPYDLEEGEWLFLKIANHSSQSVNVVAIDLAPDWSITQVSPGKMGPAFWTLDERRERLVQIQSSLPSGCDEGTDVIKVIATLGPADFRWLELPALGAPDADAVHRGVPANPLEQLFSRLSATSPTTRNVKVAENASEKWTTAQVEIRVHRSGGAEK
jgi:hypothetical protein